MYTIRQAALRSGVSPALIRAWERRYGVVRPMRTPSGYRVYDEQGIATLRAMRRMVAEGWQPSAAAHAIASGDVAISGPDRASQDAGQEALTDRFVRAASAFDRGTVEALLDEMFSRASYEAVIDEQVLPAAAALGDAWASGTLDVAAEHAASGAIMRRLAGAYEAAARNTDAQPVLVGMPPGARHELGALAFAVALRRLGTEVLYLGPDVPIRSWVGALEASGARAAVIGAVTSEDGRAAREVGVALLEARPGLLVATGGRGSEQVDHETTGIIGLPSRVVDAAAEVARLVGTLR
jgi:MerR family transcriptional regulator, light-induced transcriptional regulator